MNLLYHNTAAQKANIRPPHVNTARVRGALHDMLRGTCRASACLLVYLGSHVLHCLLTEPGKAPFGQVWIEEEITHLRVVMCKGGHVHNFAQQRGRRWGL